jgi:hypothetical protein
MKLNKKVTIGITKEERNTIREITNIVEDVFNIEDIEDRPEVLVEVILGIYGKYGTIRTSLGDIEVEYDNM